MFGTSKNVLIAASLAIAIVASVYAASTFWSPNSVGGENRTGATNEDAPYSKARRPPPMPIVSTNGVEATTFDIAKDRTQLASALTLPTAVPDELEEVSIRIKTSDEAENNLISVFYTPADFKVSDNDTFEDVMINGGIAIIYSKEPSSADYSRDSWMKKFVDEDSENRHIQDINGSTALVMDGNPPLGQTYQVYVYNAHTQINLVSMRYDVDGLIKVAASIK